MPDQKPMWTRCLGGFSVMWVTNLLSSPVKKMIFCPKTTKFSPKLAFLSIAGSFGALLAGWLVVLARAVSRQHCRLSICENWLSWTNTETAAATPPTVMQNLLRASAQWLVLESAVFWLISPPTWVNWYLKMFLVHFTHYSGGESGNFVRNLWILSYNLSLKFGEALLLVRTEYWTNESFAPNLRSLWHIPQIWGEAPIGWILCADQ